MLSAVKKPQPWMTIAQCTLKGYVKERVLLVVLIFAFILMVSSYVLSPLAVGAQRKIIVDIGLGSISAFGILLVVLLGAGSYAREKHGGVLAGILAKPISRVDFIIGKYVGTTATIATVMLIMAVVYLFVLLLSRTQPSGMMFVSMYLSLLEVALVMALLTFFSTFTTPLLSSFFTLCVFISGHFSSDLLELARLFGSKAFYIVSAVGYYVLPNMALFNVRSEAVHGLPLPEGFVYSVSIYGIFYTLMLLLVSAVVFRVRDVN